MVGLAVNYTDDTIHCDAGEAGRFAAGRQGFERERERESDATTEPSRDGL